jgi:hypothetical protein
VFSSVLAGEVAVLLPTRCSARETEYIENLIDRGVKSAILHDEVIHSRCLFDLTGGNGESCLYKFNGRVSTPDVAFFELVAVLRGV